MRILKSGVITVIQFHSPGVVWIIELHFASASGCCCSHKPMESSALPSDFQDRSSHCLWKHGRLQAERNDVIDRLHALPSPIRCRYTVDCIQCFTE